MRVSHSTKEDDRQLIGQLLQDGADKRKGEETLFSRYAYILRDGMKKNGLSEDEAFNAYSDSVLAVIGNITDGSFQGNSSLGTYLYKIFHNKCVDLVRKNATNKRSTVRTQPLGDQLSHYSDKSRSILQTLIDQADWKLLKARLTQLSDECRKILSLWAESYSDKEIAAVTEYKTADVVKTSRLRCLERLRRLYNTA